MIIRFSVWFIHKIGIKTLIGFSLLLMAMSSVAFGFAEISSELESQFLVNIIFGSLIFTWIFARSKIKGWIAGLLLVILGVGLVFISVGQLWGPLWGLLKALDYQIGVLLGRVETIPTDINFLNLAFNEVYRGVTDLAYLFYEWIRSILYGPPFFSKPAITLVWGWAVWGLAAWAGWFYRRRNAPLAGLLPGGTLLAAGLSYTWSTTNSLPPFLFSALLLLALTNYDLSERHWKSSRMDFPEDLPKEFSALTIAVVTGIIAIAILLPIFSFENISKIARNFTRDPIEEAEPVIQSLGVHKNPVETAGLGNALSGGLPRSHLLGSGPELTEKIVMTVKVSGGVASGSTEEINLPLYWRSLTYEEYTGIGWRSQDFVMRSYKAGTAAISPAFRNHRLIQQDFRLANAENRNLFAAGDIVTVDHAFKIAWRSTIRLTDVFEAPGEFFGASIDEPTYRVQSLVPIVSAADLQTASGDYPGWVTDWYLALPDSVPNRVRQLAEEITTGDENAYDRVRSIEAFLRDYEYSLDLDLPPLDRDMVDYFLFTLKKGYCDYYASSMVVLARSLGIPARLVIGYARGNYDDANKRYIVTEADAHSWVEIYFQGIGWIPFEPTAGREPLGRFEQEPVTNATLENETGLKNLTPWYARINWNWQTILGSVFAGLVLLILGIISVDGWRIRRLSTPLAIEHIFQRFYGHGRRLHISTTIETTPQEFSSKLINRVRTLSQTPFWKKRLIPVLSDIQDFTQIYSLMRYRRETMTMQDRKRVIALWQLLRRRLWLARLRQFMIRNKKIQTLQD